MPAEPQKIGRYEIRREIGRGGMGVVYLAFDPVIAREVALKILNLKGFTEDQAREIKERFQREAMAAGRLNDPQIVTVYDMGEHEGEYFIAMEYVPGRSLEDILEEDALLSLPKILEIVEGIATALDHAHSHGIVHRDIKPANILLLEKGGVRVTDFGIARIENLRMTREGAMLGSPSYMSPEQILGREIDGRSDIFSLGVILYILLTGEKPFPGESLATLSYRIVQENPTPPSQLVPGINSAFDAIIEKVLAKDPNQRYPTAGEMVAELKMLISPSLTNTGSGFVVKTLASSQPVEGVRQSSFPSITAIPVPESKPAGIFDAPTEIMRVRPARAIYVAGGLVLLFILGGLWFLLSMRDGGNGTPASATTRSSEANYKPLGIVPRPYTLWRELQRVLKDKKDDDMVQARSILKELEILAPSDADVHLAIGKVEFKKRRNSIEIPLSECRRAILLDPELRKDPELISQLVEALDSPHTVVRNDAMAFLVDFIGDTAEKPLIEAAASPNKQQSKNALSALVGLWSKRLSKNPKDIETRLNLAGAYFRMGDFANSIAAYKQALIDRPEEKKNPEITLNLIGMLSSDQADAAVEVLGKQIGEPAVPHLKKTIETGEYDARWKAVAALELMGKGAEVDKIALLIADLTSDASNCTARQEAMAQLEGSQDPRATEAIRKAKEDPKSRKCLGKSARAERDKSSRTSRQPRTKQQPITAEPSRQPKKKRNIIDKVLRRHR